MKRRCGELGERALLAALHCPNSSNLKSPRKPTPFARPCRVHCRLRCRLRTDTSLTDCVVWHILGEGDFALAQQGGKWKMKCKCEVHCPLYQPPTEVPIALRSRNNGRQVHRVPLQALKEVGVHFSFEFRQEGGNPGRIRSIVELNEACCLM